MSICKLCKVEISYEGYCVECERIYGDISPCYNCQNRQTGCHSECGHYNLWLDIIHTKNERITVNRLADTIHNTSLARIGTIKMLNKYRGITKRGT